MRQICQLFFAAESKEEKNEEPPFCKDFDGVPGESEPADKWKAFAKRIQRIGAASVFSGEEKQVNRGHPVSPAELIR